MKLAFLNFTFALLLAGCGGGSPATTVPATTGPGVADHLKEAAKEVQAAGTKAVEQAKPYVEAGAEKVREGVHAGAAWVEEKTRASTATAPSTLP